jgi:hypothetical protein
MTTTSVTTATCEYCLETIERSRIDPRVWWDWQGTAYCDDNPEGELGQHRVRAGTTATATATATADAALPAGPDVGEYRDWDYELGITDTPMAGLN